MRKNGILRKGLAVVLAAAMVFGVPVSVQKNTKVVKADETPVKLTGFGWWNAANEATANTDLSKGNEIVRYVYTLTDAAIFAEAYGPDTNATNQYCSLAVNQTNAWGNLGTINMGSYTHQTTDPKLPANHMYKLTISWTNENSIVFESQDVTNNGNEEQFKITATNVVASSAVYYIKAMYGTIVVGSSQADVQSDATEKFDLSGYAVKSVESEKLYSKDFEGIEENTKISAKTGAIWVSKNGYATDFVYSRKDETHGIYTELLNNTGSGYRGVYTQFGIDSKSFGEKYIVEFDAYLANPTTTANNSSESQIALLKQGATSQDNAKCTVDNCVWEMSGEVATDNWTINSGFKFEIPKAWVHIKTTVNTTTSLALIEISGTGDNVGQNYFSQYISVASSVAGGIGIVGGRGSGEVCIDNINVANAYKSNLDISSFRGATYSAPTLKDHVFAGWYTDAKFTSSLGEDVTTGKAYAKFVDAKLMDVKFQKNTAATNQYRIMIGLDSTDYNGFSFAVKYGENTKSPASPFTTVYNKVRAGEEEKTAAEIWSKSTTTPAFVAPCVVNGVSESITVTPSWVTADGTTVTGTAQELNLTKADNVAD